MHAHGALAELHVTWSGSRLRSRLPAKGTRLTGRPHLIDPGSHGSGAVKETGKWRVAHSALFEWAVAHIKPGRQTFQPVTR